MSDEHKIAELVRKRDYAADVLGNLFLAWSYQQEIDKLVYKDIPVIHSEES